MKTKNLFFSIRTTIGSMLWLLLNILSYWMVFVYALGLTIIRVSKWENLDGERFQTWWPQALKIGKHNWILPYHFIMVGMCVLHIFNPALTTWLIYRIFFVFVTFEFLAVVISYIHKWTDEADTPLWSSIEYDNNLHYGPPYYGWGS